GLILGLYCRIAVGPAHADVVFVAGAPHIQMAVSDEFLLSPVFGGQKISLSVPINPGMTSNAKADRIALAMRMAGASRATSIGNTVIAPGYTIKALIHSNEKDRIAETGGEG